MRSREPISDTNVIQDIGNGVTVGLIGSLGFVAGCRDSNGLGSSTPQPKRCAWKGTLVGGGKGMEDRRLCDKMHINTLMTLHSLIFVFVGCAFIASI